MTQAQIVNATILKARAEVGVREIGNTNRGRRVDEYQRADTLPGEGYPWCASFQAWRMLTTLGPQLCDEVWLRSASCDKVLEWGRNRGILSDKPALGAMGLVMASKTDATHIFDVDEIVRDASAVMTVEGNTNDGGSRNGNGVYRRKRVLSNRYLYLHWMKLLPQGATLPGHFEPKPVVLPESPFEGCPWFQLIGTQGQILAKVPVKEGRSWFPARKWAELLKTTVEWKMATQSVWIHGREVPAQSILIDNTAWLPLNKLTAHHGLGLVFKGKERRIEVQR